MQARSWNGRAVDYVRSNPSFDPEKTPSADGIITEIFRRWPGTLRSRHAIWSSSANGARARELLDGHEHADPPFGAKSPWGRLCDSGGHVLMLGVGLRALSLYHSALDMAGVQLPFPVYTEESFPVRIIQKDGTETIAYSKAHTGKINGESIINSLVVHLERANLVRNGLIGKIQLHYLPARESVDCMIRAIKHGAINWRYVSNVRGS
jgi:aminoglycoside 3-N-acetyltransferase